MRLQSGARLKDSLLQDSLAESLEQPSQTSRSSSLQGTGRSKFRNTFSLLLIALALTHLIVRAAPTTPPPDDDDDDDYYDPGYNSTQLAAILAEMPDESLNYGDPAKREAVLAKWGGREFTLSVDSIEPEGGPTYGNTRVLVRGGPFTDLQLLFPHPKCKFGRHDLVVDATYVLCTTAPTPIEELEPRHRQKNDTCLQCDNSPAIENATIIPFTVSLIGDFSDSTNSMPYRYYKPTRVFGIKPRYGPKDGLTFVEVWGENFLNFDENTRCNFGQKSVVAHFVNSNYMTCTAPFSDVVGKPVPFSISLNKQQNSKDDIKYYYYNWPQVTELVPNYGPDTGGNRVIIRGNNFMPFIDEDIDNSNDTFCEFEGIGKSKAYVLSSTKMYCEAPPNFVLDKTNIEITLNNQQYTDDNVPYYYFRPPTVFDIDPREGPTKGGTEVTVFGDRFKPSKNVTCKFGDKLTRGTFLDQNRILCVSPAVERAGYVPLTISYEGERYSSEQVKYLYYESPEITNIAPVCGPVTGYTQITVYGKNFLNMGFGKAKCIFNMTYIMNATIMEQDILKCDSPPLQAALGYSEQGTGYSDDGNVPWYNISITINGKEIVQSKMKFEYYVDPTMWSITPNVGPLKGGTNSTIKGNGFKQPGVCNVTVRYGTFTQYIKNYTDTEIQVLSPAAKVPDAVTVSIALNGQQFINDKTLHFRDFENTFTYFQDLLIQDYSPKAGPTYGGTVIKVKGLGFKQFKTDDGEDKDQKIFIRFRDAGTGAQIGNVSEAYGVEEDEFTFKSPPAPLDTKAHIEFSFNQKDWVIINVDPTHNYSFTYYSAPKIGQVSPSFGPVKSPNNETVQISGQNFNCPDPDCKDLYVRFGDPVNGILVKGEKVGDNVVQAQVPRYTKPDVLPVEITFNGQDFTHDNQTYGFFDPFILDIKPRLISTAGTTRVRLYGFGFVNSTQDLKTRIGHIARGLYVCNSGQCVQQATYIDPTTIESPTFPQKQVNFGDDGSNVGESGMAMEASVQGNTYTENNLEVWYFEQPIFLQTNVQGAPSNQEKPIFTSTNFKWDVNEVNRLSKYGNFTCRFKSMDGKRVAYTKARMEIYPLGTEEGQLPTHVRCSNPKWKGQETVLMDISVNGQDYSGNFTFYFYESLDLYRIVPMSGPNEGGTRVKMIGSGFNSAKDDVFFRWGVLETEQTIKEQVLDYIWNEQDFILNTMVQGSEILLAFKKETFNSMIKNYDLTEGQKLKTSTGHAPRLPNQNSTHGGPIYVAVGEHLMINVTNYTMPDAEAENSTTITTHVYQTTIYQYSYSFIEYYYYIQPVVKKVEPRSGLTQGYTRIEVSGAWFQYRPEYGVVPHCKIGDKVTRAKYFSTVRIVCHSAPQEDVSQVYPVYVSLNGVDYIDTGFTYRYYTQPALYNMTPSCGPATGGTQIYITGSKFDNISDPQNFNCRFTSEDKEIPPKYIPGFYVNDTTMMCSSPGGWGRGDATKVQVTFNGEDYSDNNFTFFYYNVVRMFPRSGPSDGSGGPIRVEGSGFNNKTEIYCSLDKTLYEPIEVLPDVIKCPMVKAKGGSEFFGSVEFAVIIDGNWQKFTGGFYYYPQIELDDMFPHAGPSEGKGIVYFYGKSFREDFPNAEIGCKIGDSVGKGHVMNGNSIKCVIDDLALVDEGFQLPATVSLNSYSWVDSNQTFVPYGVTAIYPNSGPYTGNTDVLVAGKGFTDDLQAKAKCRFGIEADFAIVDAVILSYDKLMCSSPSEFKLPPNTDQTLSVPISISFLEDELDPWTDSVHRFRFYSIPKIVRAEPDEVDVGKMAEVYVFADENTEFWEPIPTSKGSLGSYGIQCKFGRFGTGMGMYVNKTTIKCLTPSVQDDPDSIWKETVKLTVALNGQDFDEDNSDADFTFVGSGSTLVFWPYVIGTLLIGLLLVALIVFCSAIISRFNVQNVVQIQASVRQQKNRPYVIRDPYNQFTARAYSAGMMGRQSPYREGGQN